MTNERDTAAEPPERLIEKGLQPAVVQATPPIIQPEKEPAPPEPSSGE